MLKVERSAFAWEWLRRNAVYAEAACAALARADAAGEDVISDEPHARAFGLHAFERPDRAAPMARPIWRREDFPYVLRVRARPAAADEDRFDLDAIRSYVTICRSREAEHLLLCDGDRGIRLDIISGSLAEGPARLSYLLDGFARVDEPLLVLHQFVRFWRMRRFDPALHGRKTWNPRWVTLLRVRDALAAGASQREIAAILLSTDADQARWRVNAPTIRSRVQRLVRGARLMEGRGHWFFLREPVPVARHSHALLPGAGESLPDQDNQRGAFGRSVEHL